MASGVYKLEECSYAVHPFAAASPIGAGNHHRHFRRSHIPPVRPRSLGSQESLGHNLQLEGRSVVSVECTPNMAMCW